MGALSRYFRFGGLTRVIFANGEVTKTLDGSTETARVLRATGSPGAAATLYVPAIAGADWIVENDTDQALTVKIQGGTGLTLAVGHSALVVSLDGANIVLGNASGLLNDRDFDPTPAAGYDGLANLIRRPASPLSYPVFTVWTVGDSVSTGYGSDAAGAFGYQSHMHRTLSARRGDINGIGSLQFRDWTIGSADVRAIVDPGEYAPMDWENDGHSGNTIAQITTGVPTWFASAGSIVPDVILLICGSNVDSGVAATELAKIAALAAAIRAVAPNAHVIQSTIPPVSGSAAYRTAFNAGLAATVTALNDPKWHYIDAAGKLGTADTSDGTHPTLAGYALIGTMFADEIERWLPPRRGPVFPRLVRRRVNATDNGIRIDAIADHASGANAFCDPGTDSFAIEGWFTPAVLPENDSVSRCIVQYASGTVGFSLLTSGKLMAVYVASASPSVSGAPGCFGAVGEPVHWLIHCDRTNGVVSLWVNGILRGLAKGVTPWTITTGATIYFGQSPNFDGHLGIHSDLRFYRGAAGLPAYGPGLRQLIQSCYADGIPLPGATAYFRCDETASPCVDGFGGTSLTLSGATMVGQAHPGGSYPANAQASADRIVSPREVGSACKLWLRGDSGVTIASAKVSSYFDQSGNAHAFAQGTAGNRPVVLADGINGRPAMSFRIANTAKLVCADSLLTMIAADGWHVFVVAQYATINQNSDPQHYANDCLISLTDGGSDTWGISARTGGGTPKASGFFRTTAPAYSNTSEITIATGLPYIFEFSYDGTNAYFRVTGGVLGTTSQGETSTALANLHALTATIQVNLGVAYDGTTYTDADIGEVIVCNKRLTTRDATRVRNMLRDYYRI